MNEREIAEIRRRMRPEKNNIGRIRGCYVNEKREIISEFDQTFGLISNDESEEILSLIRRTLSGSVARNLIGLPFTNQQVSDSEEHKLLSVLRDSSLSDGNAARSFFEKAAKAIEIEGSFMILLANDKYDIYVRGEDGEKSDSAQTFSYIICSVCPIKTAKPSLGYSLAEKKFKNILRDSVLSAPELGFMFPTYENGGANIYNALFYTHDISMSHIDFTTAIFGSQINKSATEQAECISKILSDTVKDDCDIEFVQAVQGQLIEITADHKNNKADEPLTLSPKDMGALLRCGGVSEDTIGVFSEKFEEDFGASAEISPSNVIDIKKFEVKTPEVTVRVSPEHSELIQTRVINGTKYILIRADGDIEVNGIKININE